MNLLTIEHLTKSYTERLLFDDTAFSVNEGEKIGVIGIKRNMESLRFFGSWRAWRSRMKEAW
mgnify:CR=1 FL=1